MLSFAASVKAQETLSLDHAIALALANEHGIRIARNEEAIARRLAIPGNAGLMPRIDASGRGTYSNQYTRLDFVEGIPDVERDGVENTALSGTLGLTYTLFDGSGNVAVWERLKLDADLADLRYRARVEATLSQVVATYFAIAGIQQDIGITARNLEISADRHRRMADRAELGGAGRLDVLNALVDLRADSVTHLLARQRAEQAANELALLMGQRPGSELMVDTTLRFADGLDRDRLLADAMRQNVDLLTSMAQVRQAETDVQRARALLWPRVDLSAGYGFIDQRNEVGIVLGTYTRGLNAGLGISVPLFEGGRVRGQLASARLRAENSMIAEEQSRIRVERDVFNAYTAWATQRQVLRVQGAASATASMNFQRTSELYYAGQLTGTQFRQAQVDLANAERQRVLAAFDTKMAELRLLQACGGLMDALGVSVP